MGVTPQTLRDVARRIPLPWQPGDPLVDIELNDRAWSAGYREGKVTTPAPGDEGDRDTSKLEDAKLRKELAQARNWELRNEALERRLLPLAEVEATWEGIAGAVDAAFGALPEKLSSRLDGDPREIKRIAREVIREIRDELSAQVEQVAADVEQSSGSVAGLLDAMDGASTAPAPMGVDPVQNGRPRKPGSKPKPKPKPKAPTR